MCKAKRPCCTVSHASTKNPLQIRPEQNHRNENMIDSVQTEYSSDEALSVLEFTLDTTCWLDRHNEY